MNDPAWMTIGEASTAISSGKLTPSELVEACLARTTSVEPDVQAWAYLAGDAARMAGRLAETVEQKGTLHGIPFAAKDIIETADMPTGYGTPIYHGNQGRRDAACVALLKEAGSVVLGKAVTTELAHFHPGKTRNPHRATHTPGGSSSGSAAVVGAGMVPFSLGTQTTGSVLRPASYCGVYGYKPSYGDVSRSGVFACAESFDTVGWFTRSVEDVEIVRQALVRMPARELPHAEISNLRVGLFRGPDWHQAEDSTKARIESAAATLGAAGAEVVNVNAPEWFAMIAGYHRTIAGYEFARAITWERVERAGLLSTKLVDGRCSDGLASTYEEYAAAQAALVDARMSYADLMRDFDVLLTPSAPGEAWRGLAATGDPVFNLAWTALHVPAISVPAFTGPNGLPVGLQLVGQFRQDATLLGSAKVICNALDVGIVRGA